MDLSQGEDNIYVCGYEIFGEVHYYIDDMLLINISKHGFSRVQLRATMGNLLHYFLKNSPRIYVSDDEIMSEVWERNNLRASSHRLWQVVKELNYKLNEVGVYEEIFSRVNRQSRFSVKKDHIVPLYKRRDK